MAEKIAVMGFGNPVRSDDVIGLYVIEQLQKQFGEVEGITFFDMGTSAFEVLFNLKGHDKVLMVDAVLNSNEPDGTVFKVPAEEILDAPNQDPFLFLHGMKWNQALSYAKKILGDSYPSDIQAYLVAVSNTKLDEYLSDDVKAGGDKVVVKLAEELNLVE